MDCSCELKKIEFEFLRNTDNLIFNPVEYHEKIKLNMFKIERKTSFLLKKWDNVLAKLYT